MKKTESRKIGEGKKDISPRAVISRVVIILLALGMCILCYYGK